MNYFKRKVKGLLHRVGAVLMSIMLLAPMLSDLGAMSSVKASATITISKSAGYEEGAFAEWAPVEGADGYKAYVSSNGGNYTEIADDMVRAYEDYYRVDEVGLPAGNCTIKIEAWSGETILATATTESLTVINYDRSGYAHFNYTDGVGAYKDDGTLKDNAIVLYVTDANKDTVSVTSKDGTTVTGIGHILNSAGKDAGSGTNSKGGVANNNNSIIRKLAEDGTPLVIRIIGTVTAPAGVTAYDSVDYGGSVGDNGYMARMQSGKDVTIEGIGSDAVIDGWGIHFICETAYADFGKSFEVRNIAFRNVPEDCVGMEGQQESETLTAPVERCWIHDCAFYAPTIANPAESDKAGGDGACDFKRGQYFTNSYCYYEGYHKTNLVGSSDSSLQYHMTYHHNYWKNCEARGPLARQANIHMYNNIYEGQTDYCMNPRANAYIFSEYNTFINCKNPVTVDSGAVKSYMDSFTSCIEDNHATIVTDKSTLVSTDCKYANFDTDASLGYVATGDYLLHEDLTEVRQVITAYTGTLLETPVSPEDVSTSVILDGRMPSAAVSLPYSQALNSSYVTAKSTTVDNIVFNVSKLNSDSLTVGSNTTGQDIVFKVDTAVNITMEEVSATYSPVLCNESGIAVLTGSGVVKNLPAGVYYIQSGGYDVGSAKYKEAKVATLSIVAYDPNEPEYAVTVQNDGNGTASANVSAATQGTFVTLTATPNEGYTFDSWEVVSGGVTISSNKFTMPGNDVVVRALFKESASSGSGSGVAGTGYVHNFTESGLVSDYYTISGNLSTSKGTVTYNGLTLTQCLKIESSTSIKFTAETAGTLVLVFVETSTNIKIDGTKTTATSNIMTFELESGEHTITKADTMNLFYMEFIPDGSSSSGGDVSDGDTSGGDEAGGDATVAVTGVALDKTSAILTNLGATTTLTATVAPDNATNKNTIWTSSNPAVATVNNGVVTAVANGTTTITVTTEDGSKTASCLVTVAISAEDGGEVDDEIVITESKGYQEGAYVEWEPVSGAIGYKAYIAVSGESYTQIDNDLIRQYADYWRVDAVGLAAGSYDIKIEAVMSNASIYATATELTVIAYERDGYAWVNGTASGAYNEDGTLKSNATVLYVTESNKADMMTALEAYADGSYPLCIRIIGNVTTADNFEKGDLLVGECTSAGLTIEGIGEDATANGWGVRIKNSSNVEVRNLGFMNCASDEGDAVGLQQGNDHIWIHDNDFFYGAAGSDSDQVKGDGALDTKKSTYVTHSYNHFWDTGKTHLNGNGDTTVNYITYHHNWYDHSDSRHPLVRCSTAVHIYNNLYDGISKYGMIARLGCSIFAEGNYFKDTTDPILISQQGTDIADGEAIASDAGGMIKSYGNIYDNTAEPVTHKDSATDFDCYEAESRDETVPDTYVTLEGGNTYSNFDTAAGFYSYTAEAATAAKTTVENYAGRVNGGDFRWDFSDASEDTNYDVITALQSALQNYTSTLVSVGGIGSEIVAPDQGGESAATYTITVDLVDGSAATSFTVNAGSAITSEQLPTPTREGYSFTGWIDGSDNAIILPYTPTGNMTVKATWQAVSSGGEELDPDAVYNRKLNVEELPAATYTESFTKAGFTVMAGAGVDQSVVVDSNSKTINGTKYTQRLKLGGAGTKDYRSIKFTTTGAATLQLGCMASNSSSTFQLSVATLDENGAFVDYTGTATVGGTATECTNGSISVGGKSAVYITIELPAAGTYYIYGKDGGINFYFMNVIYANGVDAPTYTVTFNAMGGLSVDSQTVQAGDACVKPADTLRSGYTFDGWYADYDCTQAYDFATPITGNTTIYAKWVEGEAEGTYLLLDMKDLPARDYKESFTKNGFSFTASSSKALSVDISSATVDEVTYTKRLKFNGSGQSDERSISFTTEKEATLTLVAESGSSGNSRALAIEGSTTTYNIENIDSAAKYTQTLPAGTWYIYSTNNGVNVYYIEVAVADSGSGDENDDVSGGDETPEEPEVNTEGLKVVLANPGEEYVYTGSAIKPAIIVTNNGELLTEGVDYTVKYSNNINASVWKTNKKTKEEYLAKPAKITVTGKGNLTGSASTTFEIKQADLQASVSSGALKVGAVVVKNGSKATPVLIFNNKKLTSSSYVNTTAKTKYYLGEGESVTIIDGGMVLTGKGNFKGTLPVDVTVVEKNATLNKFTVTVNTTTFTYDGKEHEADIIVKDSKTKEVLTKGEDYIIVYGSNYVNAGTVKFTVIGINDYTGTVAKSYKIKPMVVKAGQGMSANSNNSLVYTYKSSGVTIGDDLIVRYTDPESGESIVLTGGVDYKLTYSNNKKVSTWKTKNGVLYLSKPAKYTVTFLGNYKGSAKLTGSFIINPAPLTDETEGLKVAVANKVFSKKGTYASAPMVTIDNVTLKSSNYTVTYYKDALFENQITKKNPITTEDFKEGETSVTVYVKIVGKGNYKPDTDDQYVTAQYQVCQKSQTVIDMSKLKVTVINDETGKKLSKTEYTGNAVTPTIKVEYKPAGSKKYVTVDSSCYEVTYVNNVKKGTATVIVTGNGTAFDDGVTEGGVSFVGSKNAKFSIVAKNIKNLKDLLTALFG